MFVIGHAYTRREIHDRIGGSTRACLPTRDGRVVAACLLRSLNPQAPQVVLCGRGTHNTPAGEMLAAQDGSIPMFTKLAANRWLFEGAFEVVASFASGARFDRFVDGSGRTVASVSRVVLLRPAVSRTAGPR